MLDFDFYNPTRIVFGKDRLSELDSLIPRNARVLILYGGGSARKYGTLDKIKGHLAGRTVSEFGGIEPNPRYATLLKAIELVKRDGIDFLLAVGGGSVMDGTKFVALASQYDGSNAWDLIADKALCAGMTKAIPLGTVVTLPATGSEMNCGAVITSEHGKLSFRNELVYPRFSILDPTLTFTLPPGQVANGVVDAFIHTTEQYLTYPVDGRFQDRTAEGILRTLIEIGRKTIDHPTDYNTRANLMWCSTLALNGLIGAGVPQDWASHRIGHELTAMFGIDHGKTLAVVAPSLWIALREPKKQKLLQYAERVWGISEGADDDRIDLAIRKTREFFQSLGVKTRLSEYGVAPDKIDDLVEALKKHGMTALSENGNVTPEVSRKILERAL